MIELRENYKKSKHARTYGESINENDIVLISEENVKRNDWRTGRVHKLLRGRYGQVRGAEIVVVNKTGTGILRRPISKLFPFELARNGETHEIYDDEDEIKLTFVSSEDVLPVVGV